MKTHDSVFKAYDIYGIDGQTIEETFADHLGRAFGSQARVANGSLVFPSAEAMAIDGVCIDWPDGIGPVRPSNTTPVLVPRFEGHTPEALHRIDARMIAGLRAVEPDVQVAASAD